MEKRKKEDKHTPNRNPKKGKRVRPKNARESSFGGLFSGARNMCDISCFGPNFDKGSAASGGGRAAFSGGSGKSNSMWPRARINEFSCMNNYRKRFFLCQFNKHILMRIDDLKRWNTSAPLRHHQLLVQVHTFQKGSKIFPPGLGNPTKIKHEISEKTHAFDIITLQNWVSQKEKLWWYY